MPKPGTFAVACSVHMTVIIALSSNSDALIYTIPQQQYQLANWKGLTYLCTGETVQITHPCPTVARTGGKWITTLIGALFSTLQPHTFSLLLLDLSPATCHITQCLYCMSPQ